MASEYFYGGKSYSTEPMYANPKGYHMNMRELSGAVDARTANQIKELSESLNTGMRNIEIGAVQPNVFEAIPKEHFKEMQRLARLNGAKLSFHAPMIDPTGITERGWDKMAQESAERQLWDSIKKGAVLDPTGTVVTFHASSVGLPSAQWVEKEKGEEKIKSLIFIDENTGKIQQVKEEKSYFESNDPKTQKILSPGDQLKKINETAWMDQLSQVNNQVNQGRERMEHAKRLLKNNPLSELSAKDEKVYSQDHPDLYGGFKEQKENADKDLKTVRIFLREEYRNIKQLYDSVYNNQNLSQEDKKNLRDFAEKVKPFMQNENYDKLIENPEKLFEFANTIENGVEMMGKITNPTMYKEIKQFAIEKSAETTANLAWKGYTDPDLKKQGIAAPVIAIENHPAQQSLLTRGSEIRAVVDEARKKFIDKATSSGLSKSEAEKQAEKLIGATWDVGHINMMRKYGFTKDDIVQESENLAKGGKNIVKKIHLSDNFGFEHTELPMGMGNVPMEEIMAKIGTEGYDVKKVIEAGDWWQHFSPGGKSNPPIVPTLQNFGSSIYGQGSTGAKYFGGYGTMLPEQHFSLYGGGFSSLPTELGGQIASKDSKFSGTPMS